MDTHSLKVIEYENVVELIARRSTNLYGREYVEGRTPLSDPLEIGQLQAETAEAIMLMESTESFTVGYLHEIRDLLSLAGKDSCLPGREILKIYDVALRSRLLRRYLSTREITAKNLREKALYMVEMPDLEKVISNAIDEEGNIRDKASSDLASIRRTIKILHNRIQAQLEKLLRDPHYRGMLQEPIITQREYRYVVPVKQEYRASFPGLILDASSSGATLFMEPTTVLDMTNEMKFQRTEEKKEEERILHGITSMIARHADTLLLNLSFLGHFDSLQASARFFHDFRCVLPRISEKPILNLKSARHPLLGDGAVPIDVRVGEDFLGLIVTGPNTGGKTVTLKTAGLLTMLALSGFPIPAGDGSIVGIFTGIYADIGDEQSISQNLSTFSSHMTNIIKILKKVDEKSLILLDELGAGTDPSEGVALASGIINFLLKKRARLILTTHYNQLKYFASHNSLLCNSAVEFDEESLRPTYRIQIGLPGRSCALKIARRLGLPEEIVEEAGGILGSDHFEMESLLKEIDSEKTMARKKHEMADVFREEMEMLRQDYENRLKNIEKERDEILKSAVEEGRQLVDQILRELKQAREMWRKSLKDKSKREDIKGLEEDVKSKMDVALERLKRLQKKDSKPGKVEEPRRFSEGMAVSMPRIGRKGVIAQLMGEDSALIQMGNIKMEMPLSDLEPIDYQIAGEDKDISRLRLNKVLNIKDRLDIRGTRVEEAIPTLSKYIDDALLANLRGFQIVHGKGTGLLRRGIQEYLQTHRSVKSFRDGDMHEGGWGVTVVELES